MGRPRNVPGSPVRTLSVAGRKTRVVEIYPHLEEVRAVKHDGELYKHEFSGDEKVYGLPDGSLLIRGRRRLWGYQ